MSPRRPLEGIRVLDFTWVRAGPWTTRWLGALGAEVIKIEWPENMDMIRRGRNTMPQGVAPGPNSSGQFADSNANKLAITLNVRTERGMALIRRLVAISDVVIENFSSRVMQRWGLGYEELRKLRPDVIYVSMAGFGHTGRHHHYTTMGPSAQALSGMTFLSGLPGKPPAGWGWSYLDDTGGMYGAMCALTALRHRDVTGRGQHVDLSQMAVGVTLTGAAFLDCTVNAAASRREGYPPGNRTVWPGAPAADNYRGPVAVPHNAYKTRGGGHNDWCTIACFSDSEWRRLVELMGSPAWASREELGSLEGRVDRQEEIDQRIEDWTLTLEKYELADRCQAAGVRAMPVQSSRDRVEMDPQLESRGTYVPMSHRVLGRRKYQNAPFRLSKSEASTHSPAPLIGQHTRQIMEGLMGFSRGEILEAYEEGVLWPDGMPREPYVEEALA